MNTTRRALFTTLILLSATVLAACEAGTLAIGMVETNVGDDWQASYTTFSGTRADTFRAEAGQIFVLEFDCQVEKGKLTIAVQDPDDEVVWNLSLQEDDSGTVEIYLGQDGRYTLRLRGEDTGGGWDLSWDFE